MFNLKSYFFILLAVLMLYSCKKAEVNHFQNGSRPEALQTLEINSFTTFLAINLNDYPTIFQNQGSCALNLLIISSLNEQGNHFDSTWLKLGEYTEMVNFNDTLVVHTEATNKLYTAKLMLTNGIVSTTIDTVSWRSLIGLEPFENINLNDYLVGASSASWCGMDGVALGYNRGIVDYPYMYSETQIVNFRYNFLDQCYPNPSCIGLPYNDNSMLTENFEYSLLRYHYNQGNTDKIMLYDKSTDGGTIITNSNINLINSNDFTRSVIIGDNFYFENVYSSGGSDRRILKYNISNQSFSTVKVYLSTDASYNWAAINSGLQLDCYGKVFTMAELNGVRSLFVFNENNLDWEVVPVNLTFDAQWQPIISEDKLYFQDNNYDVTNDRFKHDIYLLNENLEVTYIGRTTFTFYPMVKYLDPEGISQSSTLFSKVNLK